MRIVSLVPSATETLSAWGVEPVACTRFCERPDLPHVGGTKNPDVDAIVELAPDLVVVDRQENRREDAEALVGAGVPLLDLDVTSVDAVATEMERLADAVGVEYATGEFVSTPTPTLSAFVPIWRRPWMTISAATYGSSVLSAIGVRNVFADAATSYPEVSLDEVATRRPDVILVPSEPYSFRDEHLAELAEIGPVERIDGQDLFWWGARTPGAIERLRAQLMPAR